MVQVETIETFANIVAGILKTDRWVFIGCDGDMGEGKSCITSQLSKATAKIIGTPFSYEENMTYKRKELKGWIDGDEKKKIKRKQEYSIILADELISMFFKRNWFDSEQIDGIELLNKCRDRHHCIIGNIPCFWDLDSAIYPIISFWIHIHERGRAWVFQKDRNPFATDKWNRKENQKLFAKYKNPYKCKGFLCEIHFGDWPAEEKQEYYAIRNDKRLRTEGQREKVERYKKVKGQRDSILHFTIGYNEKMLEIIKTNCNTCKELFVQAGLDKPFTNKALAEVTGMDQESIRMIKLGLR